MNYQSGSSLSAKDKIDIQKKKCKFFWGEIITFDPSIYIMEHHHLIVSNFMEKAIGLKWAKL